MLTEQHDVISQHNIHGCATAQAVNGRLLTSQAVVWSQPNPRWEICGGQNGSVTGFSPSTSLSVSLHECPILIPSSTTDAVTHKPARACRVNKILGIRSLGRLNCVRLRLISVDPEYGPCFTPPFRQPRILRWLLDFWKILSTPEHIRNVSSSQKNGSWIFGKFWVLLNTYVMLAVRRRMAPGFLENF